MPLIEQRKIVKIFTGMDREKFSLTNGTILHTNVQHPFYKDCNKFLLERMELIVRQPLFDLDYYFDPTRNLNPLSHTFITIARAYRNQIQLILSTLYDIRFGLKVDSFESLTGRDYSEAIKRFWEAGI